MIKSLILILISLSFFSCRNDRRKKDISHTLQKKGIVSVRTVENIEKNYGKKINVQEYVLSQNADIFFERVSTIIVFGQTTNGKLFKGPVMWFKNYFDEKIRTPDFSSFFRNLLTKPQKEDDVKKILGDEGVYLPDQNIILYSDKSEDYLIAKFLEKDNNGNKMRIKPKFLRLMNAKYTIAYLFYQKGYILIEDDYEPAMFFLRLKQMY